MSADRSFSVIYRTGGTDNCNWQRVFEAFPDRTSAQRCVDETERAGRKAIVVPTESLNAIGLPIGWTPECVDWQNDHIIIDALFTHHRKANA